MYIDPTRLNEGKASGTLAVLLYGTVHKRGDDIWTRLYMYIQIVGCCNAITHLALSKLPIQNTKSHQPCQPLIQDSSSTTFMYWVSQCTLISFTSTWHLKHLVLIQRQVCALQTLFSSPFWGYCKEAKSPMLSHCPKRSDNRRDTSSANWGYIWCVRSILTPSPTSSSSSEFLLSMSFITISPVHPWLLAWQHQIPRRW